MKFPSEEGWAAANPRFATMLLEHPIIELTGSKADTEYGLNMIRHCREIIAQMSGPSEYHPYSFASTTGKHNSYSHEYLGRVAQKPPQLIQNWFEELPSHSFVERRPMIHHRRSQTVSAPPARHFPLTNPTPTTTGASAG